MPITYIRLLKFLVTSESAPVRATCVVSLTSDLGDASYPDAVPLTLTLSTVFGRLTHKLSWTGTHAVQKFEIPLEVKDFKLVFRGETEYTVSIQATPSKKRKFEKSVDSCSYLCRYMTAASTDSFIFGLTAHGKLGQSFDQSSERALTISENTYSIRESTKESIMSHIWDAGLVLSALLTSSETPYAAPKLQERLARLSGTAKRVVELGTGIGLVGISMGVRYPHLRITVSDLSTARDLVESNIALSRADNVMFEALDWTNPTATMIQPGMDLLVMSDVTYNETYHDALLDTIDSLVTTDTVIVFASKYRHISERAFIRRLVDTYQVLEKVTIDGSTFTNKSDDSPKQEIVIGDVEIIVLKVCG